MRVDGGWIYVICNHHLKSMTSTFVPDPQTPLYLGTDKMKVLGLSTHQIQKLRNYYEMHSGNLADDIDEWVEPK